MGTTEDITLDMVPEFEPSAVGAEKFHFWAALDSRDSGMTAEGLLIVYGLTEEQLIPYEEEWSRTHAREMARSHSLRTSDSLRRPFY